MEKIKVSGMVSNKRLNEELKKLDNQDIKTIVSALRLPSMSLLCLSYLTPISNVVKLTYLLRYTYAHMFGVLKFLSVAGYLKKTKYGRTNSYEITDKGKKIVEFIISEVK